MVNGELTLGSVVVGDRLIAFLKNVLSKSAIDEQPKRNSSVSVCPDSLADHR